jgi:hypothetical protein
MIIMEMKMKRATVPLAATKKNLEYSENNMEIKI